MMRFFEPSKQFLDWLAKYAGKRITFDVGCGEGHITEALIDRGVKCLGIDPRFQWLDEPVPQKLRNCIIPMEAEMCYTLRTTEKSLVLFCRPCHSGFVTNTIDVLPASAEVLYISKPDNVHVDIMSFNHADNPVQFEFEELETPRCREERVYKILRTTPPRIRGRAKYLLQFDFQ